MNAKEIAQHYEAKIFDTPDAAKTAGFLLTETMQPRNVWNKASAANAIVLRLVQKRKQGEAEEIGLVIEAWSITGCYRPGSNHPSAG
jgi:hypothetical protein